LSNAELVSFRPTIDQKGKSMKSILSGVVFTLTLSFAAGVLASGKSDDDVAYEVWASDQSNSVSDAGSRGVKGSYIWIWDSEDINTQLSGGPDAVPSGCDRFRRDRPSSPGPCDLLDVFPQDLKEYNADGQPTGNTLADLQGFGRLHGMLIDPQQRYLTVNIFAPSGGYVGVIDTHFRNALALFRVTGADNGNAVNRNVHMSFWNADGSQIIIANLAGKLLERIDVKRTFSGRIRDIYFNKSATLSVGKGLSVGAEATFFKGRNAHGRKLKGRIVGEYSAEGFSDLTPNGVCKENGCTQGPDAAAGGRPNNVIICPIPSENRKAYVTMGGGGLLVVDTDKTPMGIVGEYGNQVINGAGCGGVQTGPQMWLNAGVSASPAGATQSTFTMYVLDDFAFDSQPLPQNTPVPTLAYKDPSNTASIGNVDSVLPSNPTGQLPSQTTRRDAHGVAATLDGQYVHNVDRIRNVVEVFDTSNLARFTYDLTSEDGKGNGFGACMAKSVSDDPMLEPNDPAPDLLERTPDGKYLMIAFRGPAPVSVIHSAQGSCPGVGIVELTEGGASGRLVGVLRSSNEVDNASVSAPGGHVYTGAERSDVHGAIVVEKRNRRVIYR
jgi:hypothetical protein